MKGLPKQQQKVYDFIENYRKEYDISPSIIDIAEGLNLANSTIATYIDILKKKGYVTNMVGIPRSLKTVAIVA